MTKDTGQGLSQMVPTGIMAKVADNLERLKITGLAGLNQTLKIFKTSKLMSAEVHLALLGMVINIITKTGVVTLVGLATLASGLIAETGQVHKGTQVQKNIHLANTMTVIKITGLTQGTGHMTGIVPGIEIIQNITGIQGLLTGVTVTTGIPGQITVRVLQTNTPIQIMQLQTMAIIQGQGHSQLAGIPVTSPGQIVVRTTNHG